MLKTSSTISQTADDDASYSGARSSGSVMKIDQTIGAKALGVSQLLDSSRATHASSTSAVVGIHGDARSRSIIAFPKNLRAQCQPWPGCNQHDLLSDVAVKPQQELL